MSSPSLRSSSSALRPLAFVLFGAAATLASGFAGCGDSSSTGDDPPACEGGVIVDGVCEGKCTPDKCLEGNVCVGNRCMLECTSHTDCYAPYRGDSKFQGCLANQADTDAGLNDGDSVLVCTDVNLAPNLLKACPIGDECDDPADPSDWACPDGSPCTEGEGSELCTAAECRPLFCRTAGEGDADAYCTTTDCADDSACAPGMYCGISRWPNKICGTDKGTDDPCIDPADFNADGATFQEGPSSLLRNTCKLREPCASCATKTDCTLASDMECVELGAEKVCAKTCATDGDCPNDYYCVTDAGFCVPRQGQCQPPATDNFCWSCLDDLDCGDASSTMVCANTTGAQKACFDSAFSTDCTDDNDCPLSPSGKAGECLDEAEGLSPGDDVYHKCYFPFWPADSTFQCWRD